MFIKDEMGLGIGNIPYVSITLTPEQIELIKNKIPILYTIDGKNIFDIRNEKHEVIGKTLFVIFG